MTIPVTDETIRLKQEIIRMTPNSGANLDGKDVIFFMKEPGVDAYLFNDGTVIIREGFGLKKGLRQWGGFKNAKSKLEEKGFRPYGIFVGTRHREYEQAHRDAKEKKTASQDFFAPVPTPRVIKNKDRLGYNEMALPQPALYNVPQFRPSIRPPIENNQDLDYEQIFQRMANINKLTPQVKMSTTPIMDFNQYANWSNKMYNTVQRRKKQMEKSYAAPKGKSYAGTASKEDKEDKSPAQRKLDRANAKVRVLSAKEQVAIEKENMSEGGIFI